MSEIKGQLLGMILVLAVFAAVSVAMTAIFTTSTEHVAERVESELDSFQTASYQ